MITLVLNSPWVDQNLLSRLAKNSVLIGVDGGLNYIIQAGLCPDWAIGDFDSVQPGLLKKLSSRTKILHFPVEKDYTDIELALKLTRIYRPRQINVLGLTGGDRFDHQVVNCSMLSNLALTGCVVKAWSGSQRMVFTSGFSILHGNQGRHFSVLALSGVASIKISGAKYSVSNLKLLPGSGIGLGNKIVGKQALILVKSGVICTSQWKDQGRATT